MAEMHGNGRWPIVTSDSADNNIICMFTCTCSLLKTPHMYMHVQLIEGTNTV